MDIYLDESGTFATDAQGRTVGVVGALVVTESQLPILERRYAQLRPFLPKDRGEVKGRLLDESEVARVINIGRRSGLIYEATVVDLLPEHGGAIEEHRQAQCDCLTKNLTEQHQPELVAQIYEMRERLERTPPQLYVQSVATFDLLWRTLQHATVYYSQREPHTLARFRWVVDAKSPTGITDWEDGWGKVVKPFMQSHSLREPFTQLEEGDYSHMAAKEMPMPDYLVEKFPRLKGESGLSLHDAFKEFEFSPRATTGLEVVDVITNALRRGLTGRLAEAGWQGIAGIMIHRAKPTYVHPIGFGPDEREVDRVSAAVLRKLGSGGRSMLT
ncbi:MAG: hypothetical protein KGO22_06570 [Gammaproteobacteria bacterium]|nr:hypothetical protein [Gammaproteobacteria bacterium]